MLVLKFTSVPFENVLGICLQALLLLEWRGTTVSAVDLVRLLNLLPVLLDLLRLCDDSDTDVVIRRDGYGLSREEPLPVLLDLLRLRDDCDKGVIIRLGGILAALRSTGSWLIGIRSVRLPRYTFSTVMPCLATRTSVFSTSSASRSTAVT